MDIKPIETVYNGYRFRSRLEARWAVFFDALEIDYHYEPEGYDLGEAGYYLPDFWLPQYKIWIEIKGEKPNNDEQKKCFYLADGTGFSVLLLYGHPNYAQYIKGFPEHLVVSHGVNTYHGWHKPDKDIFYFDSWVFGLTFEITEDLPRLYEFLTEKGYNLPTPQKTPTKEELREQVLSYVFLDRKYWSDKYGGEHPNWKFGFGFSNKAIYVENGKFYIDFMERPLGDQQVLALQKAKQARFEHSERAVL